MSERNAIRNKVKQARLEIVAELYRRGSSYRYIQREAMRRLDIPSYSLQTVKKDVDTLLKEWRENRIEDTDCLVQLELERIDETVRELWEQWEKSKEDYKKTSGKIKGKVVQLKKEEAKLQPVERETQETDMRCLGDIAYISEIRAQLVERRKLLGLYAPEKWESRRSSQWRLTDFPD
jgi:hypothetical protein